MALTIEDRDGMFRVLAAVLAPYAKRWKAGFSYVARDALGYYSIEVKGPGSPMFATLFAHLTDVRVYFHPLRVWKDLSKSLPASVKKRIVQGSVFAFKTPVTAVEKAALVNLFAEAARRIDARMKLTPKLPYTKKLSAKQLAALGQAPSGSRTSAPKQRGRRPPARPPRMRA